MKLKNIKPGDLIYGKVVHHVHHIVQIEYGEESLGLCGPEWETLTGHPDAKIKGVIRRVGSLLVDGR